MPNLPTGTVTFLFTDLEGSTQLWDRQPEAMRAALGHHDRLLRQAAEKHGGNVFKTGGDAFCVAFHSAPQALAAALEAQLALHAEDWGAAGPLRAIGFLEAAESRDGDLAAAGEFVGHDADERVQRAGGGRLGRVGGGGKGLNQLGLVHVR